MFKWLKKTIQYSIAWDLQKDLYDFLKKIVHLKFNFKRVDNNISASHTISFRQVLSNWGLKRKEIPKKIKFLYWSCLLYFFLGCWGIYLLIFSYSYMVKYEGILLIILFVTIVTTKFWRINILSHERFISFSEWLKFPLLFKKNGGE